MIQTQKVRELFLQDSSEVHDRTFLSAASGLILFKNTFYVVADDEFHLGIFPLDSKKGGVLHRLFSGQLPNEPRARKKQKPDLEGIVLIQTLGSHPSDLLLTIPSGSKKNRTQGALLTLEKTEFPTFSGTINFEPLYEKLSEDFSDLNIEGAVVLGSSLKLFQRGNGSKHENAVIDLDLELLKEQLEDGNLRHNLVQKVHHYELGKLNGVPLSFTDAAPLEDGQILFIAAAENSKNTYEDGTCAGSVLGAIDSDQKLFFIEELSPKIKAEGLCITSSKDLIEGFIVTDHDDPNWPSELLSFSIPKP